MGQEELYREILPLLAEAELVYRTGQSPEEIDTLALIFSEALEGEDIADIQRAFKKHIRESTRFPTPCHILTLVHVCHEVQRIYPALEAPQKPATRGLGKLYCYAMRGNREARDIITQYQRGEVEARQAVELYEYRTQESLQ